MSLSYYKLAVILDKDAGGQNGASNQNVEIRNLDGSLASIYSDEDGTLPITQPSAKTDSKGDFEFYAVAGKYVAVSGSFELPIYIGLNDDDRTYSSLAEVVADKSISPTYLNKGRIQGVGDFEIVAPATSTEYLDSANGQIKPLTRDLRLLGSTGATSEDVGSYIASAVSIGWDDAIVSNDVFSASGSVDGQGIKLIGNGTYTGGSLKNVEFVGIDNKISKSVINKLESAKEISTSCTPKLFFRRTSTTAALVTLNATGDEYIYHQIAQTSDSSPALSVGAPFESMRPQQKWRCSQCIVYRKAPDSESAGVTGPSGDVTAYFGSGTRLDETNGSNQIQYYTVPQNDSLTYTFIGRDFSEKAVRMNVAVFSTSGSSELNTITVNGVDVKNFDARADSAGNSIQIIEFDVQLRTSSGNIDVVITNDTGTGTRNLYVIGLNMRELRGVKYKGGYDAFTFWYSTSNAYCDTNGASDYAYQDESSGLFAGSYHGGETSSYLRFSIDGTRYDKTSLPVLGFEVGNSVSITQRTNINAQFDTYTNWIYHQDGVEVMKSSIEGTDAVTTFYTNLFPAADGFDYIVSPKDYQLPSSETTEGIGYDTNEVIQYNSSTTQYVRHSFTRFDNSRNFYGGPHIWNRVGTYRKIYYGPVVTNKADMVNFSFEYQREFGFAKY